MQTLVAFYLSAIVIERLTEIISKFGEKPEAEKNENYVNKRAWILLAASSVIGLIAAFSLHLGFLASAGVKDVSETADYFLSGIALGAGTKPTHDIISYIEKVKDKKTV
jgi:hypothetical protein